MTSMQFRNIILDSSILGVANVVIGHPFDTVKVSEFIKISSRS